MTSSSGHPVGGEDSHDRMIRPIGIIRSCFAEKFVTPRQPGLVPDAWGELALTREFANPDFLRGIEGFSHLWLIFGFHQTLGQGWHPTVRPPRLGGNARVGTFATRSTFRPNGLGLSVVRLEGVRSADDGGSCLRLGGIDLIDGTPVYDVKPYLPFVDAIPDASPGFASSAIPKLQVSFTPEAATAFQQLGDRPRSVISQALALDPRPATAADDTDRPFGAILCGHHVRFRIVGQTCEILEITQA